MTFRQNYIFVISAVVGWSINEEVKAKLQFFFISRSNLTAGTSLWRHWFLSMFPYLGRYWHIEISRNFLSWVSGSTDDRFCISPFVSAQRSANENFSTFQINVGKRKSQLACRQRAFRRAFLVVSNTIFISFKFFVGCVVLLFFSCCFWRRMLWCTRHVVHTAQIWFYIHCPPPVPRADPV